MHLALDRFPKDQSLSKTGTVPVLIRRFKPGIFCIVSLFDLAKFFAIGKFSLMPSDRRDLAGQKLTKNIHWIHHRVIDREIFNRTDGHREKSNKYHWEP